MSTVCSVLKIHQLFNRRITHSFLFNSYIYANNCAQKPSNAQAQHTIKIRSSANNIIKVALAFSLCAVGNFKLATHDKLN